MVYVARFENGPLCNAHLTFENHKIFNETYHINLEISKVARVQVERYASKI